MKSLLTVFAVSVACGLLALGNAGFVIDRSVMSDKYWQIWNDDAQRKIDADIEANHESTMKVIIDVDR